jgi:hypothetical protein
MATVPDTPNQSEPRGTSDDARTDISPLEVLLRFSLAQPNLHKSEDEIQKNKEWDYHLNGKEL